jgi:DNA-binding MarR family transcriptional regulator
MREPITDATLRALRRILRAADQGARRLAATTGLTPSQMLALQEIDRQGETTPSRLATALQFSQPTVTNIVDRLELAGLVARRRSEQDRRQMLLSVTSLGRERLTDAPNSVQESFQARFKLLPSWEQAMILASLERLGELLDAHGSDAAPLIDAGPIDRS